jgi:crotonobetainyl-CoA:carnitine CoA-transferase CaiB-like acyl-CoA transferase
MTLPLAGLRVLDLTNVMAGPFCCYQLALLGAEVIKVELPKTGDLARQLGADPGLSQNLMGASFLTQNAGKKSITLNLKDPRGRDLLKRLAGSADALVESFRPGVMIRLGVDAAVLRIEHPRLVYCALSGFGQTGPLSARPAYDQVIQGLSGLMSVTGDETSAPLRVGFPVSDAVAGLNAALAVCAALAHAARTGEGGTIDVSMLESSIAIAAWVVGNYLIAGEEPQPMGNENRTAAPSGVFRTQDGLLNIAANKQEQWRALTRVLGREELTLDPRFAAREARKSHRYELRAILEEVLAQRPAVEWEQLLTDAGVPAGQVLSVKDAIGQRQLAERGMFRTFEHVLGVGRPVTVSNGGFLFEGEGRGQLSPPPRLGEHTDAVLTELGLGPSEIEALRVEGVL